jgi:argininosuccinate lyase
MKTLWQKNKGDDSAPSGADRTWFYRFTAEEDRELDRRLVPYDILVNLAQARMLLHIGVYDKEGFARVTEALRLAWSQWNNGEFDLGPDDEDVHSAVERFLTEKAGQEGARIHTGRSRNDQVLADMRLYMKDAILGIAEGWMDVADCLVEIADRHKGVFFAGLTHTQPAMPHSADAWAAGYYDLLKSDLEALRRAYELLDQSPLGSAAGYGVPHIPVDREFIAEKLGFTGVQVPVAASQLSRGRFEMQLADALMYGALTFNRMAADVVLFMHPSLALVSLSEDQVSGSSIMPQKRNPDAWELIRGAYHGLASARTQLAGVPANLTSGYHRDLQVVKKGIMSALETSRMLAEAVRNTLAGLAFDADAADRTLTPEVFATHEANKLVSEGVPFREAYRKVAAMVAGVRNDDSRKGKPSQDAAGASVSAPATGQLAASYHHTGAPGSGVPEALVREVDVMREWTEQKKDQMEKIRNDLVGSVQP